MKYKIIEEGLNDSTGKYEVKISIRNKEYTGITSGKTTIEKIKKVCPYIDSTFYFTLVEEALTTAKLKYYDEKIKEIKNQKKIVERHIKNKKVLSIYDNQISMLEKEKEKIIKGFNSYIDSKVEFYKKLHKKKEAK